MAFSEPTTSRPYDGSGRRAAAAERRVRIAEVAWRLFTERGWTSTRLADVAREADVSVELVGKAFNGKQGLLMAAMRRGSFGDHADLQAAFAALDLGSEPDRERRVARLADFTAGALVPMAPMLAVLHTAADQDEELRVLADAARARHIDTCLEVCRLIAPEPVTREVVDEVGLLTRAETYLMLVVERGWSLETYTAWLRERLSALLLSAAPTG